MTCVNYLLGAKTDHTRRARHRRHVNPGCSTRGYRATLCGIVAYYVPTIPNQSRSAGPASNGGERLLQIGNQVVGILHTNGQAHHVFRDTHVFTLSRVELAVRHTRRVLRQ